MKNGEIIFVLGEQDEQTHTNILILVSEFKGQISG